jgi:hypothetical protein
MNTQITAQKKATGQEMATRRMNQMRHQIGLLAIVQISFKVEGGLDANKSVTL